MANIGTYRIVRSAWLCNICFTPTFKNEVIHKCHSAPHFLGNVDIAKIPKKKLDAVLDVLKT